MNNEPGNSGLAAVVLTAAMDNVLAYRIAQAHKSAAEKNAGDFIDRGLALRAALEEAGFGIIQLDQSPNALFGGTHTKTALRAVGNNEPSSDVERAWIDTEALPTLLAIRAQCGTGEFSSEDRNHFYAMIGEVVKNRPALQSPQPTEGGQIERDRLARIINPHVFASWQSMYDHCLETGDSDEIARVYADNTYKPECDKALAIADKILAALRPAQSDQHSELADLVRLVDKIVLQAKCLEGYAEQDGYKATPPSVYHWQATHFRDIAAEIRTVLRNRGRA